LVGWLVAVDVPPPLTLSYPLYTARIQLLNGIKVIKLYAWERPFMDDVMKVLVVHCIAKNVIHSHKPQIRNGELEVAKTTAYLNAVSTFTWTIAPFLVSLVSFIAYTTMGNELTPVKVSFQ
jgi:hypothetical protein